MLTYKPSMVAAASVYLALQAKYQGNSCGSLYCGVVVCDPHRREPALNFSLPSLPSRPSLSRLPSPHHNDNNR